MPQLSKNEKLMLNNLEKYINTKGVSSEFLLQLIELSGAYLNIRTISQYAKENNLTYNGVKYTRCIKEIFNVKFVIDNQ